MARDEIYYGLQISQEGIPINRAADYQKVLDDRWPFLDIVIERDIDVTKADWPAASGYWTVEVLRHDLGYLPAFKFREYTNLLSSTYSDKVIIATKTSIYIRGLFILGDPTTAIRIQGKLRVFACPVAEEFSAPINHYEPRPKKDAYDYGVKILKHGSRIRSKDASDFSLNTDAKALSIQQTGVVMPDVDGHLIITHNMGYPPTFMIAYLERYSAWSSGYANPLPEQDCIHPLNNRTEYGSTIAKSNVTTATLDLAGAQAALTRSHAYLIIKDPVEVAR